MDHSLLSHPGLITGFAIVVSVLLMLDLGVFNKKNHVISNKEATVWTIVWISLAMVFSGVIYWVFLEDSPKLALEKFSQFQSAYWIEKALSVDNLFVFILVFGFFKVPKELHHKVLFWGVLGALLFRAIFIFAGVELINRTYLPEMELFGSTVRVNLILTLFGIFLIIAGIKSGLAKETNDEDKDFEQNPGARLIRKFYKVSKNYDGAKLFTIENGVKVATPLLVVIAVIEFTDLIFAVDSIPAIFSIAPDDPFILYTSNIFAIMGLRSLYFLLANFIHMFSLLKYGLAIILTFIGVKMVISPFYHMPSPISLSIVGGVLILSVLASLLLSKRERGADSLK